MNAVFVTLVVAVLIPLIEVGTLAYRWWGVLARPWLFAVIGLIALYGLSAAVLTWTLSGVGISGVPPGEPQPLVDWLTIRMVSVLMGYLAVSLGLLWVLRSLLAKSS